MPEHLKRMLELGRWALPENGALLESHLQKLADERSKNPALVKEIKRRYKKARAIAWSQLETGAGLPMDKLVRHFANEYNWRNLNRGLRSMPGSFNVMESFYKYDPSLSVFRILEERDHWVSFLEFLDFVTSGDAGEIGNAIESIEEDVIYSYNFVNGPSEMSFTTGTGAEFVLGGVSLVRRGDELTILMLGGEKTDTDAKTLQLKKRLPGMQVTPGREWLSEGITSDRIEAVQLLETKDLWQVLILSRVNIESMTQDVRHLMWDAGASFEHLSDDVFVHLNGKGEFLNQDSEKLLRSQFKRIREYDSLFEACKSVIFLPHFFELNADLVTEERHETEFATSSKDLKRHQRNILLSVKEKVRYRRISILRKEVHSRPDWISMRSPDFKVEASGYWKPLKPADVGEDRYGNPIHGRTWVKKTLSWVEAEGGIFQVARSGGHVVEASSESGYIYVMRSAAHPKDVFKIGLTRRSAEMRADELSSETGVIDKFLVVEDWQVKDYALAERLIHERLEPYRLNPKREFFKASYKTIIATIEEVIESME